MDLSGHEGEIPVPITSTYVGGHGQSHTHIIIHGNPPPLSAATTEDDHHSIPYNSKRGVVVKYKECLKNHAASMGGNATDGCGEFMPSGEEGTLEALKCSACSCHRNFHRRETEGEATPFGDCYLHLKGRKKGVLLPGSDAFGSRPSPYHMIMPIGALQTSESDEGVGRVMPRPPMVKKRFRTRFTPEQKEKMVGFAERAGWMMQKQEESVVQQFCQEIGVKRRVLKVWMHNNKHNFANKSSIPS